MARIVVVFVNFVGLVGNGILHVSVVFEYIVCRAPHILRPHEMVCIPQEIRAGSFCVPLEITRIATATKFRTGTPC